MKKQKQKTLQKKKHSKNHQRYKMHSPNLYQ